MLFAFKRNSIIGTKSGANYKQKTPILLHSTYRRRNKDRTRTPDFSKGIASDISHQKITIQPKLKIGQPGDKYEQEADRIADMVVGMEEIEQNQERMSVNNSKNPIFFQHEPQMIQRTCSSCSDEEEIRLTSSLAPSFQTQLESSQGLGNRHSNLPINFEATLSSLENGGKPISVAERSYFETRLGTDLSHVRLHSDSPSNHAAEQVNSKAFTYQNHIVFSKDQYQPNAKEGRRLIAHELVHVLQQQNLSSKGRIVQRCERRPAREPYEDTVAFCRINRSRRTDRRGTIHNGIRVFIPSEIDGSPINVDIVIEGIYAAMQNDVQTVISDRARSLLREHRGLRTEIAANLESQHDENTISIEINYIRQTAEQGYRVSAIRINSTEASIPPPPPHPPQPTVDVPPPDPPPSPITCEATRGEPNQTLTLDVLGLIVDNFLWLAWGEASMAFQLVSDSNSLIPRPRQASFNLFHNMYHSGETVTVTREWIMNCSSWRNGYEQLMAEWIEYSREYASSGIRSGSREGSVRISRSRSFEAVATGLLSYMPFLDHPEADYYYANHNARFTIEGTCSWSLNEAGQVVLRLHEIIGRFEDCYRWDLYADPDQYSRQQRGWYTPFLVVSRWSEEDRNITFAPN